MGKYEEFGPKQNKQKRHHPLLVFAGTLLAVLFVGTALLALLAYGKSRELLKATESLQEQEEESDAPLQEEDRGGELFSMWEKIPEPEIVETEEIQEEKKKYADLLADPQAMQDGNIYAKDNKREGIVSIGFVGDILFDDEYAVMANLLKRGSSIENAISEPLLAQMQEVDIMMINNEFPYTNRGTPTEGKTYTFRADTSTVSYLKDMGADIVALANNHLYDFGEQGLLDTLDTLEEAGIPYVGAGHNIEEASKPVYFIAGDMKIAIVNATQIERLDNPDTKGATENSPGVFRCWNPERMYSVVREAKENSDFTIVYIHWGTENVAEPDWAQLEQAKGLEEAGADLVIGDHSHCLQGIQYYGDVPVFYSLGNFWFNSKTLDTCMVRVDLSVNGIEQLTFIPAIQSGCKTDLAYGEDNQRILSYMNSISYGAVIDGNGIVSKK